MKGIANLITLCLVLFALQGYSQDTTAHSKKRKSSWSSAVSFAGQVNGEITIKDHLEDSLSFADEEALESNRVKSFRMTVTCNGVPLKYLENKSGNQLTAEMKREVIKFRPGCILVFDAIRIEWISKEFKGAQDFNSGTPIRFTMK